MAWNDAKAVIRTNLHQCPQINTNTLREYSWHKDKRQQRKPLRRRAIKGFVIAGTKSGSGKTTITLGFLAALVKRGLSVGSFKVGPDFIDPGHHTRITGRVSRNLDGWMLPEGTNRSCFNTHTQDTHVVVVEGVMGLFDGYDGKSEAGSTAQMAKWLKLPVILVVDAKSMARSAAALVQGFENFDPNLTFAGVLFNNVGSPRHLHYLKEALESHVRMPCLGGIGRKGELAIPERHLGLYTTDDHPLTPETVDALSDLITSGLELDELLAKLPVLNTAAPSADAAPEGKKAVRIGVARDNAFCFYYQDNLDLLASSGATIVPFSPIADPALPADLDGLYFGGGYPELFAPQLAQNQSMRQEIRRVGDRGMPIYGECGGFMYLGETIRDVDGNVYPMAGCFPLRFKMFSKLKSLGYREVTLTADTLLGKSGQMVRGHEFHYSELAGQTSELAKVYRVTTRTGLEKEIEGYKINRCLGSYIHLHFGSNPQTADAFIAACLSFKTERTRTNET